MNAKRRDDLFTALVSTVATVAVISGTFILFHDYLFNDLYITGPIDKLTANISPDLRPVVRYAIEAGGVVAASAGMVLLVRWLVKVMDAAIRRLWGDGE